MRKTNFLRDYLFLYSELLNIEDLKQLARVIKTAQKLLYKLAKWRWTYAFRPNLNKIKNLLYIFDSFERFDTIIFPDGLKTLECGFNFNQLVVLPQSLQTLIFGHWFNQPIVLPPHLKRLALGNNFNHPIVFPAS